MADDPNDQEADTTDASKSSAQADGDGGEQKSDEQASAPQGD